MYSHSPSTEEQQQQQQQPKSLIILKWNQILYLLGSSLSLLRHDGHSILRSLYLHRYHLTDEQSVAHRIYLHNSVGCSLPPTAKILISQSTNTFQVFPRRSKHGWLSSFSAYNFCSGTVFNCGAWAAGWVWKFSLPEKFFKTEAFGTLYTDNGFE